MDERLKFVAALLDGEKMAVLCRQFGVSGHWADRSSTTVCRWLCYAGDPALDQPMAVQNRMYRTDRRGMDIRIKPCQPFPYLRGSPASGRIRVRTWDPMIKSHLFISRPPQLSQDPGIPTCDNAAVCQQKSADFAGFSYEITTLITVWLRVRVLSAQQ
jgi:hypothetical protein